MEEVWKDIPQTQNRYAVSNMGRIRFNETMHIRNIQSKGSNGYLVLTYRDESKKLKTLLVHHLVANAFIPNPEHKNFIDHINTIRTDNRAENLRWCTAKENSNNPITRRKMSLSGGKHLIGKHRTEETKRRVSSTRRERIAQGLIEFPHGKDNVHSLPVSKCDFDGNTIETYVSIKAAALANHFHRNYISKAARGLIKVYKGYLWRFDEIEV